PNERSLAMACSGLALERDPLPSPTAWRLIEDRSERLRVGLGALYGWYERNAALTACVLRDAEFHPLIREIVELRMGPTMAAYHDTLGAKLSVKQRALLGLALSFFTWQSLVRDGGLRTSTAAKTMAQTIVAAA